MKDDLPWLIGGALLFYLITKQQSNTQLLQLEQLQLQAAQASANASNPWLTVPGAVSSGLAGLGSVVNSFSNLFSD